MYFDERDFSRTGILEVSKNKYTNIYCFQADFCAYEHFSLILYPSCISLQELYKNLNMSISPNLELEDSLLSVGEFVLHFINLYNLSDFVNF